MSETGASIATITLRVKPGTAEWGTTDSERWRDDLHELEEDLARSVPGSVQAPAAGEGEKGFGLVIPGFIPSPATH